MPVEDVELLRRYVEERSEAAFTDLVGRHIDLVYHAALRKLNGDVHRAQDVTQSVFSFLAQQASSLRRHEALAGWLHTTTRYAANRLVRSEQRRKTREREASLMHEISTEPTADAAWEKLRPVVDDVLGELNAEDRSAVLLRFFSARSLAEVGAALGLSENAARMRIERALDKLRSRLARRGITSTSAALGVALANHPVLAAPAGLAASVAGSALTSVAGVMAPAWGILQFMSTTKFIAGAAALTLALVVGFSVTEIRSSKEAARALALVKEDGRTLQARLEEAERRARAMEDNLARLERANADARAARMAEERQLAEAAARSRDPGLVGQEFLAAHPEARVLASNYIRAWTRVNYQLLFESLGLTSEQIQQFVELRLKLEGGVTWNTSQQAPAAQFNLSEMPREEIERGLKELLGDAGYRQYQEFDRSRGARSMVDRVARTVFAAGTPLSLDQASRLVEIITRNSPDYRDGRPVSLGNFDWSTATNEAGTLLTDPQLAAFVDMKAPAGAPFQKAMNQAVGEAMRQAKVAAGVPLNF